MKKFFLIFWVLSLHAVLSDAQNGLVVHYDFSGSATDQSGNGNDGTLYGGASANDTLSLGDNTQDYLTIPPGVLNGLNDFAITFKIKFNSFHTSGSWPTNHILTGDQTNLTEAFGFSYDMPYQQWWLAFNGNLYTFDDPNLQPGVWYCFLLERDSTGLISLYRDGTQNNSTYSYSSAINIQSLLIGQEDDCFGGCFVQEQCTNGKLDEFKIYNRSLTASEIANNCNQLLLAPQFSASDTDLCQKFCLDFFDESNYNPTSWEWIFPGGIPSTSTDQNPANICYNAPGLYDVTLITISASGSDTLTLNSFITVYSNPFAPVITQNGNVLTSSFAFSYQWQLYSNDITGATNQSYTITQPGLYTIVVENETGCSAESSTDASMVGIAGMEENVSVNIFPNPSNGAFEIDVSLRYSSEVQLTLLNSVGQIVFSSDEENQGGEWSGWTPSVKKKIDLRNGEAAGLISAGVYFIEIKTKNDFIRKKIIIE